MHQLKALIWKSYKVRLRSTLLSSLDFVGPIVIIMLYLLSKLIIGSFFNAASAVASQDDGNNSNKLFNSTIYLIDPIAKLPKHLCTKLLYLGDQGTGRRIEQQCGLQLIASPSKQDLVIKLASSLQLRINHQDFFKDLSTQRSNNSTRGCFTIPGTEELNYQAALILAPDRSSYELYMTDGAVNPVIHQPYTQGSPYNEYKLPHSDLNSGYHLLESCIVAAIEQQSIGSILSNNSSTTTLNSSSDQNWSNQTTKIVANSLRLKPFPMIAASQNIPVLFMVFILAAFLCNIVSTVVRVSDDNEHGLHHYIRSAGVSSFFYWTSQLIVTFIHMSIQSLVQSCLLAIPASNLLNDPFQDSNITIRWLILLTFSMSINNHATFVASLFDRTSHAILVTSLLATGYCMCSLTFMLQWTPYGFTSLGFISDLLLLNPTSNYLALLAVLYAINLQTGETLNWSHLSMGIIGGGISDWSLGSLWMLMLAQAVFWFLATVLIDQLKYSSSRSPFALILNLCFDLFACLKAFTCCSREQPNLRSKLSNSSNLNKPQIITKSSVLDINRVCCSMKQVTVEGPTIQMAHTKGDPLKMDENQMKRLLEDQTSKYVINRSVSQHSGGKLEEKPILLDEAIQQHIVWSRRKVSFENLNLDFKFNQVSYILGQTDLKELLFATLLGLRTLQSGQISFEGVKYEANNLGQARSMIGYLGERDIFLNEMSIFENLQFFGSLRDPSYTQFDSESSFVLSLLHLTSRKSSLPAILTNRSARKLALAVAAVGHTKLLLLVEPTLSLRWKPRCQVLNLLKKYRSIRSIVVDTSDIDEATAFGDRIILLRNGKADLDGTSDQLTKKLACGHWLVFESSSKAEMRPESVKTLETLTSEVFKQDKLERLFATKRSVYQEFMKSQLIKQKSPNDSLQSANDVRKSPELMQRMTWILKVRHSMNSNNSLCALMKMFGQQGVAGFKLAELSYESLEDVLVMSMSKAQYPNLPPDLLLSLQHRTREFSQNKDQPQVSVRRCTSTMNGPKAEKPMLGAKIATIITDRASRKVELLWLLLSMLVSLGAVYTALWSLRVWLELDGSDKIIQNSDLRHTQVVNYSQVEEFYKNRVGLYLFQPVSTSSNQTGQEYFNVWTGNKKLTGIIDKQKSELQAQQVTDIIQRSKDVVSSIIFLDPKTGETLLYFEPYLAYSMMSVVRSATRFRNELNSKGSHRDVVGLRRGFKQNWHEAIRGYFNRRFFYGLGFALAEGVSIGVLIIAPVRHRNESKLMKIRMTYWLGMAIFDLLVSLLLIAGYVILIMFMEGIYSVSLLLSMVLILVIYKLAAIPIAYLVSLIIESALRGFLFIVLVNLTVGWVFAINLKTFIEWTLFGQGYLYLITTWMIHLMPISSLINSLTHINHIGRIDALCPQVPAYTQTYNIVDMDGVQRTSVVDKLMQKVQECLVNGKKGISTNVLHQQKFGILWDFYLIGLFALIAWTFLLFSEKVFGILARRFNSTRSTHDAMKTIIRSPDTSSSLSKWDREKDRLVSDYIRCINDSSYVKQMTANCYYLRIWLKPLGDQTSIERRIELITNPLFSLGHSKNEVHIELKTTLQLFIRVGSENVRSRVDKIQLIETYTKFMSSNSDLITKFAVVDWTHEMLYKILLHGHYNTKSSALP